MKPLFIPLKTKFFEAFKAGTKDTEYRPYGPRWNGTTCAPGRQVVLSKGYGKHDRLTGVVESFYVNSKPGTIDGWVECYGETDSVIAACIKIRLSS